MLLENRCISNTNPFFLFYSLMLCLRRCFPSPPDSRRSRPRALFLPASKVANILPPSFLDKQKSWRSTDTPVVRTGNHNIWSILDLELDISRWSTTRIKIRLSLIHPIATNVSPLQPFLLYSSFIHTRTHSLNRHFAVSFSVPFSFVPLKTDHGSSPHCETHFFSYLF